MSNSEKNKPILNLLSGWTPDTFRKPVLLVSTIFDTRPEEERTGPSDRSTAIMFGHALDRQHLIEKAFASDMKPDYYQGDERSEMIEIKQHDTYEEAKEYHMDLMENMNRSKYEELYTEHCPELNDLTGYDLSVMPRGMSNQRRELQSEIERVRELRKELRDRLKKAKTE